MKNSILASLACALAPATYALAFTIAVQPAIAADISVTAPVAASAATPMVDWSGFYFGAQGGYGWGRSGQSFATLTHYNNAPGDTFSFGIDGALLGVHTGYNYVSGSFVYSLEGSLAWSGVEKTEVISPLIPTTDRWTTKLRWLATITPRVGVTSGAGFAYLKGGLAVGNVFGLVHDDNDFFEDAHTRVGWTAGVGYERMLAAEWILGLEYNYVDLGSKRFAGAPIPFPGGLPVADIVDHKMDVHVHTVLARLTRKFATR